jgi:branched-chain amino acid transport system permease protein
MGIGSFSSALLVMKLGLSFWLALPLSGLIAAIIALILGYPILRVRGIYFVIITLAFSTVVALIALNWNLLGGYVGITGIPRPNAIGSIDFSSKIHYYYLILLLAAIAGLVIYRIETSRFGRILRAIGEDDVLTESIGVDLLRYKLMAFAVGSFWAGVAGAFFAHYLRYTSGDLFGVWESLQYVIFAIVGGTASAVAGPVIGVFVLTIFAELLPIPDIAQPFLFGAVLIQVVLTLPGGLISLPQQFLASMARLPWRKRKPINHGTA